MAAHRRSHDAWLAFRRMPERKRGSCGCAHKMPVDDVDHARVVTLIVMKDQALLDAHLTEKSDEIGIGITGRAKDGGYAFRGEATTPELQHGNDGADRQRVRSGFGGVTLRTCPPLVLHHDSCSVQLPWKSQVGHSSHPQARPARASAALREIAGLSRL